MKGSIKIKVKKRRPVLSIEYHPSLPSLSKILSKHWRVMTKDPYLAEIFPLPPMVSYRRPENLKDKLVRAKVPKISSRPKRKLNGMKRCPYSCLTCPYVQPDKTIKASATSYRHDIEDEVNCQTANVVYSVSCENANSSILGRQRKHCP